jgi:hypothetical protein
LSNTAAGGAAQVAHGSLARWLMAHSMASTSSSPVNDSTKVTVRVYPCVRLDLLYTTIPQPTEINANMPRNITYEFVGSFLACWKTPCFCCALYRRAGAAVVHGDGAWVTPGVVVRHLQHCFFVQTPPVQGVEAANGLGPQGATPQLKVPHVTGAGVVVTHKQHCFFVQTPPSQMVPVLSGFAAQGVPPQLKVPHVKGGVVGAGVVVTHKQHCFFVHTPPSQMVPVLSGFVVQGVPPQVKVPHVKGGVVGAGVVVAQRQHCLLEQTLPMQILVATSARGSHGVLHVHDEQYVGGVVVGAGVVVRHSQH